MEKKEVGVRGSIREQILVTFCVHIAVSECLI